MRNYRGPLLKIIQLGIDNQYFLSIASVEDFGNFEFIGDPWSTQLLEKQLDIYKPLIKKFYA